MTFNKSKIPMLLLTVGIILAVASTIVSLAFVLQLGGTLNPLTYTGFGLIIAGLVSHCFKYGADKAQKMNQQETEEEKAFKNA